MEGDRYEGKHGTEPIQGLMRQDVGGCRCGAAGYNEPAGNNYLAEY